MDEDAAATFYEPENAVPSTTISAASTLTTSKLARMLADLTIPSSSSRRGGRPQAGALPELTGIGTAAHRPQKIINPGRNHRIQHRNRRWRPRRVHPRPRQRIRTVSSALRVRVRVILIVAGLSSHITTPAKDILTNASTSFFDFKAARRSPCERLPHKHRQPSVTSTNSSQTVR